jgi:hypothetical protein
MAPLGQVMASSWGKNPIDLGAALDLAKQL